MAERPRSHPFAHVAPVVQASRCVVSSEWTSQPNEGVGCSLRPPAPTSAPASFLQGLVWMLQSKRMRSINFADPLTFSPTSPSGSQSLRKRRQSLQKLQPLPVTISVLFPVRVKHFGNRWVRNARPVSDLICLLTTCFLLHRLIRLTIPMLTRVCSDSRRPRESQGGKSIPCTG